MSIATVRSGILHLRQIPMSPKATERGAKVGIAIQFLALVRCLGEVFRLKYVLGPRVTLADVEPFVEGALIAAVLCAVSVGLYFFGRHRGALAVSALTVAALVAYRAFLM